MDKQKTPLQEMEDAFAAIQFEEEEQGGLSYGDTCEGLSEIDTRWCMVGRFLTDSPIDFQAMQHRMAALWRSGRGLYVKQLESNKFLFQFYHEIDIKRVIEGNPWTFGRFHLVMARLKEGENPREVEVKRMDLWVQLHGMNAGFMSQRVATDIGNYIGSYISGDPNNFVGVWREFLRIRVTLPLDIPIKRRMKIRKSEQEWCWVNFKYEAIPTFCFICGLIGHGERFCDKIFDIPMESIEKPYGAWLRADPRRKTHTLGAKWLRNGGGMSMNNSGEMGKGFMDKESPGKDAHEQQLSIKSGIGLTANLLDRWESGENSARYPGEICTSQPNQLSIQNSNMRVDNVANGPNITELKVMDPKRRRVSLGQTNNSPTDQDQPKEMETLYVQGLESKNELLAGAARQTRHSS
ncbi:CCHC-type domain-containing protein [Heracleum sosnowskyi]|uniref:CCHC-type domain-containing protein n=1 Tax=Heracleum sosnowskyi TaxID=360622 RepID=A0AAD8N8H7_9APIA|nr:CCHC-type domain-containing protein [Heracleum sosnowskyi]